MAVILPRYVHALVDSFNQPAAMLGTAEERREARRRVEAGPTEPVDRSGTRHQRRSFAVADQGVIFERRTHWANSFFHGRADSSSAGKNVSILNSCNVTWFARPERHGSYSAPDDAGTNDEPCG